MDGMSQNIIGGWKKVRSNPIFVAASSAATGAIVSALQDELASGHIDWTRGGFNKLTGYAVTAAIAAVVHLYRQSPSPNATINNPGATFPGDANK